MATQLQLVTRGIHVLMDLLQNAADPRKGWILAKWPREKCQGTAETSSSCSHHQHLLLVAMRHSNSSSNYTGGKPGKITLQWQHSPWALGRKSGGDTARTNEPKWPKGFPTAHGVLVSSKSSGKGGRERIFAFRFALTAFAFPSKHFASLQEGTKHLPADGKSSWFLCLHTKLCFTQTDLFSLLLSQFSSPSHWRGAARSEQLASGCSVAGQGQSNTFPLCNI